MATFVLIHGSWHGGWCWRSVAAVLRDRGHQVFAPTLSGCAERHHHAAATVDLHTHVQDIVGLLFYEDLHEVVLVPHSYAGMVAQGVLNDMPERLASVVFLDSYLLEAGQQGFDLWSEQNRALARRALEQGNRYRDPLPPQLLGIVDAELAEWVAARLTPHPLAAYASVLEPETDAAKAIARAYIHCTEGPIAATFAQVAETVRKRGWRVERLAAPHDAMLTHPQALAAMLEALLPQRQE